jgi:hypothetical protein
MKITDTEVCEKQYRKRSKSSPNGGGGGEAQKVLKLYLKLNVYSNVYTFKGDTVRRQMETSSGGWNFSVTSVTYDKQLIQKVHKRENKQFYNSSLSTDFINGLK